MKIKFPINNDRDYEVVLAILNPQLFNIEYASSESRNLYYSLTEQEREEIKKYIEQYKK